MSGEQENKTYDWTDWGGMQPRGGGCGCILLIILAVGLYLWLVKRVPEPAEDPVPAPAVSHDHPVEILDPIFNASLLVLDEDSNLVIAGAGELHGVKAGDRVEIVRVEEEERVIAIGTVTFVHGETCGVSLVGTKLEVKESDRVWIQLTP